MNKRNWMRKWKCGGGEFSSGWSSEERRKKLRERSTGKPGLLRENLMKRRVWMLTEKPIALTNRMELSWSRIIPGEDSDSDYGDIENNDNPLEDEDDDEFTKRVTNKKMEKLCLVDHSKIYYEPFRKNFYIEVKEISKMTPKDVGAYRKQLELKIHGKDVPKAMKIWHQTGVENKILEMIKSSTMKSQCQFRLRHCLQL
ncbi:DEAD-box ATP-dependent RNA helicase 42 [Pyrus ussuriensis x Pyrus communis]|uniref:DEAD-box ATP-dependent RNA helicase 42 n=1 Tax=Pyrus ussuriensis x Pyrus communis TaxID=2448454 RepID=A0A5N5GAK5_9ROSA|nr:DEAD-box ATP-dependent RNA helicase 42 [Pyrus ussuriensis x Pyrus communis]